MSFTKNRFAFIGLLALLTGYSTSATLAQESGESETPPAASATPQADPAREAALRDSLEEFDKADVNGDGYLSRDEFKPKSVNPERELPPEVSKQIDDGIFAMFDADKDGKISKYEYVLMFNKQYDNKKSKAE